VSFREEAAMTPYLEGLRKSSQDPLYMGNNCSHSILFAAEYLAILLFCSGHTLGCWGLHWEVSYSRINITMT